MHPRYLTAPVRITGPNIFGLPSSILFSPTPNPGWYWKFHPNYPPIPATRALVGSNLRRLTLRFCGHTLQIYEHIGSLRWTGLDGVIVSASGFPPYTGRPWECWKQLRRSTATNGTRALPWIQFDEPLTVRYPNAPDRYLAYQPGNHEMLEIHIIVDFPGLGRVERQYLLPLQSLDLILKARTLGWPPHWYYPSAIGGALGLWRHHKWIAWPQTCAADDLLEEIANHRAGDLLGALSLVFHDKLLSGKIISHCAGHWADAQLLRHMSKQLQCLSAQP